MTLAVPITDGTGVGVATLPAASPEALRSPGEESAAARVLRLAHGRLTLDEVVSGAWAALGAGAPAACPVCDAPMVRPEGSAVARCGACGTELA